MNHEVTNLDGTSPRKGVSAVAAPEEGGFRNPGLPPHVHRNADVDPRAEKRAERIVAGLFIISILGTALFCLILPVQPNRH